MRNPEIAVDPASKRRRAIDRVEDPAEEVRRGTSGFKLLVLITHTADCRTHGAQAPTSHRDGYTLVKRVTRNHVQEGDPLRYRDVVSDAEDLHDGEGR